MSARRTFRRLCALFIIHFSLFISGGIAAAHFTPPNYPVPTFPDRTFNLRDFGAKGDGKANDTAAFNKAFIACSKAGGGTVYVPPGNYLAASVRIQNNVRLQLDKDATITGGPAGAFLPPEPNPHRKYQDFGHSHFQNALMWGENVENFAVLGGTIDGGTIINGDPKEPGIGDKIFAIRVGKNLHFEGTTFTKGGHFVYLLNDCENITIANTVIKRSRDAIDLMGCRNVQIYDNHFTGCGDDTVGIKSDYALGRRIKTENIYVWNCYFETGCNGIQFGSETAGDFYNINVWGITIGRAGKAALGITCNDSAIIDGVRMNNIKIKGATTPVYMLISDRLRTGEKGVKPGVIRNVVISNVTAEQARANRRNIIVPATISGLPDYPLENITLENIKITMPGSGTAEDDAIKNPVYPKDYSPRSLGKRPAAGIFIRHVRGLTLRNVKLAYENPDKCPPLVAFDVHNLTLDGFDTQKTEAPHLLRLEAIKNLEIRNSRGLPDGKTAEIKNKTM
ncbi:glycoside hydrolase family 28 protein [Ereboglobus luteus]|uniref:Rhamnogalacturonase A/B/Epimerase-like pectate lyase domain-containing protein n=1 Tax=Ereboglobus luteus TaxID=1796921 RepID=A0A2U8E6V3_9BACT|nr:glycosyl hydrolase family 28-related protein [Ereboglobus luteus]AWI10272.1 hypothetical protein CKA38_14335 [Ereboglobus luteus]